MGTENCLHWMYSTLYANFFTKVPAFEPITTTAVEAVHFARGFHTNPVRVSQH